MNDLNIQALRKDFPILHQKMHGCPLVYLDNANTTQKPKPVIESITEYYTDYNANVHRSVYQLSAKSTENFQLARKKVQNFMHAKHAHEIIFVRGTTEGINLIAQCFGKLAIESGDEILISAMEHHSNILPWQFICEEKGAHLKVIPVDSTGEIDLNAYQKLLTARTKIVAVTHVSNAIGTINPIQEMIHLAHEKSIPVLIDGAQGITHLPIDVQALDCDFYVFSGHKLYGPTGIGVVYGKEKWLNDMPPYQGGGSMIQEVTFEKSTYNELPYKFEAGTAHIAGAISLGVAVDYVSTLGMHKIAKHEKALLQYATQRLLALPNVRIIGPTVENKAAVISFVLKDIHPHDIGTILDTKGVAVRVGHHCCMPLMQHFAVPATVRLSFAVYNTFEEIDIFIAALQSVQTLFRV